MNTPTPAQIATPVPTSSPTPVSDTDEDPHTRAYGHTDSHKHTVADTGSNRHECPSGNIHTPNNRVIVADTLPLPHAGTDKLAYVYADPDTIAHGCAD